MDEAENLAKSLSSFVKTGTSPWDGESLDRGISVCLIKRDISPQISEQTIIEAAKDCGVTLHITSEGCLISGPLDNLVTARNKLQEVLPERVKKMDFPSEAEGRSAFAKSRKRPHHEQETNCSKSCKARLDKQSVIDNGCDDNTRSTRSHRRTERVSYLHLAQGKGVVKQQNVGNLEEADATDCDCKDIEVQRVKKKSKTLAKSKNVKYKKSTAGKKCNNNVNGNEKLCLDTEVIATKEEPAEEIAVKESMEIELKTEKYGEAELTEKDGCQGKQEVFTESPELDKPEVMDESNEIDAQIDGQVSEDLVNETDNKVQVKKASKMKKSYVCDVCDFVSPTASSLKSHARKEHKEKYTCDICFVEFSTVKNMHRHRLSHFYAKDGSLKESAIIIHKRSLKRLGIAENLDPELVKYIEEYDKKMVISGNGCESVVNNEVDDEVMKTEKEAIDDENSTAVADSETYQIRKIVRSKSKQDQLGKFKCEDCGCILTTERLYQKHVQMSHGPQSTKRRKYRKKTNQAPEDSDLKKCPHCDFVCVRLINYQRHLEAHNKPLIHKCDQCSYTNHLRAEVNRHKRNSHAAKTIMCDKCPTRCRNQILLNHHIKQKHTNIYRTMCDICAKSMTTAAYKVHVKNKHGPTSEADHKRRMCQKCGKICRTRISYERHMLQAHTEANTEEETEVAAGLVELLPSSEENGESQTYVCKVCFFPGKYPRAIIKHILQVHTERNHKCTRCNAAFPLVSLLERHQRVYHEGRESCQCTECGRLFLSLRHLRGHMLRVHLTAQKHRCPVCDAAFYLKLSLDHHMLTHGSVQPQIDSCEVCGASVPPGSTLCEEHVPPQVCLICSKSLPSPSALEEHFIIHAEPFVCPQCGKTFKVKKYLDVHLLSHSSPCYTACQSCSRLFQNKEELENHFCSSVVPVSTSGAEDVPESVTEVATDHFVCTNCGEMVSGSTDATQHKCTERGGDIETLKSEEPQDDACKFICLACGAKFTEETEANQHMCSVMVEGMNQDATDIANNLGVVLTSDGVEVVSDLQQFIDNEELGHFQQQSESGNDNQMQENEPTSEASVYVVDSDKIPDEVQNINGDSTPNDSEEVGENESESPSKTGVSFPVYMCGVCSKIFLSAEEINAHMVDHDDTAVGNIPVSTNPDPQTNSEQLVIVECSSKDLPAETYIPQEIIVNEEAGGTLAEELTSLTEWQTLGQ